MNDAFRRYRKSTNIEDRRIERDLNKPVSEMSTDPRRDLTTVDPGKVKLDRFRAQASTMEQFAPNAFKRKRK